MKTAPICLPDGQDFDFQSKTADPEACFGVRAWEDVIETFEESLVSEYCLRDEPLSCDTFYRTWARAQSPSHRRFGE